MKRVVVTGIGGITPLGSSWPVARDNLMQRRSGIRFHPDWDDVEGLQTRLGAPALDFDGTVRYPRKKVRTMGRVSLLAARATELALQDAGLEDAREDLDRCGVSYGSTSGSMPSLKEYALRITVNKSLAGVSATDYLKFMSHTTAANLAQFFGLGGRLLSPCSACTSGSQAIGLAYEAIKYGKDDFILAGGAEELHILAATVFDIMYATSTRNDAPHTTPRPFDVSRDGLVVGEGACTFVLESLERAQARGARIYAEIVGFGSNCDGAHIVSPSKEGMQKVMELSLADAAVSPDEVGYVCAHGTATEVGDIAESQATRAVFQRQMPISSLKSYMGHTLGACGAIESWFSIMMMLDGWFAPTINLKDVDPRCADLDYLTSGRSMQTQLVMNNNFAFGGINTSLIFRRMDA